jgi:hypothetical protein
MSNEINEIRTAMDQITNEHAAQEKMNKMWSAQLGELTYKYEDAIRTLNDMEASKKKLGIENSDLSKQVCKTELNSCFNFWKLVLSIFFRWKMPILKSQS